MRLDTRRYSQPGSSSVVVAPVPVRPMAAGLSRRDTLSDSLAERLAFHRWAAAEVRMRALVAYRSAVYRLAGLRLVAYRPVALAALVEYTPEAGVSAEREELAAYTRPSPGVDRPRAIVPAAARSAVHTQGAAPRAVCRRVACRPLCQRNPRAAGSTRAGWDPHRRPAADSMPGALARQRARPEGQLASRQQIPPRLEERSGQRAHPGPPRRSAAARSADTWRRQGQAVVDGNEDSSYIYDPFWDAPMRKEE
jgi:hypothetical protein